MTPALGSAGVRLARDDGALQLVLHVPDQAHDGVFADALFDHVAVGVVAVAFVFEDDEPVVLDAASCSPTAPGLNPPSPRQQVMRRIAAAVLSIIGRTARARARRVRILGCVVRRMPVSGHGARLDRQLKIRIDFARRC